MSNEQRNMELRQTPDHVWHVQDMETFARRDKDDVVVRWPGQPPTHGIRAYRVEAQNFFVRSPASTSRTGPTRCSSLRAIGRAPSLISRAPYKDPTG